MCLQKTQLTEEHIIPESLGGRLICYFLCQPCNSKLGSRVEAAARFDPSIRVAVSSLSDKLPLLYEKLTEMQPHIADSKGGQINGIIRKGDFHPRSHKKNDGSLIQSTQEGRKTIEKILQKHDYGPVPIQEVLSRFDNAPDNEKIQVMQGITAIKWSVEQIKPDLNTPHIDPLVLVKIAYEYLVFHINSAIYNKNTPFEEIRNDLLSGNQSESYSVECLVAKKYRPLHGICFEGNDPHAKIQIRLFGKLAYRVNFLRLAIDGPRFVYTHMLDSNEEDIQNINSLPQS